MNLHCRDAPLRNADASEFQYTQYASQTPMDDCVAACRAATRQLLALGGHHTPSNFSYEQIRRALVAHELDVSRAAVSLVRKKSHSNTSNKTPDVDRNDSDSFGGMVKIETHSSMCDRLGRPVVLIQIDSSFDPDEITRATSGSLEQWLVNLGTTVRRKMRDTFHDKSNGLDSEVVLLVDIGSTSVAQFCSRAFDDLWRCILLRWSKKYPDFLAKVLIVKSSPSFVVAWTTLRTFLPTFARDRVYVLGSLSSIQEHISMGNLPATLGGMLSIGEQPPSESVPLNIDATVSEVEQIKRLTSTLRDALEWRDMVEVETIRETMRVRSRFASFSQKEQNVENSEHPLASLHRVLALTVEERDAYRRAVDFARNFIATENKEGKSMKEVFESRAERIENENRMLSTALERAMLTGSWCEDEV